MFTYFDFVDFSYLNSFIIFLFYSTNLHHGQGNWSFFKNNWSKLSTSTLKKPVLSSSAAHTSFASNSTQISISSQLDTTSNTYNIHSCVTPQNKITVFRPLLQPLMWRHWMLHCILHLLSYTQPISVNSNYYFSSWLSGLDFIVFICLNNFFMA